MTAYDFKNLLGAAC